MSTNEILVGLPVKKTGTVVARATATGETAVQDAHGRFQEAALTGNLFSGGMSATSIAAATFTTATLGATGTPIAGVWNPINSGKNLVILQVKVQPIMTAATVTGYGALMYASSLGNSAVSTGNNPLNRGTGVATGSVAKDLSGLAMTGQTTALVVRDASGLGSSNGNFSQVGTAVGFIPSSNAALIDNIDGSIVVPPGGIFAVLATTTPVAVSAASSILWEEISL